MINGLWRASMGRVLPSDADEMLIWEIAVLLGHADELDNGDDDKRRSSGPTAEDRLKADTARNLARLAASRGEGPMPEARPVDPGTLQQLSGALSGG